MRIESVFRRIVLVVCLTALGAAGLLEAQVPKIMSAGKGWRLIDADPLATGSNNLMWEVREESIDSLPIDQAQKDMLYEAFADDPDGPGGVFFASQELLEAMESPDFPAGYEPYITLQAGQAPDNKSLFGCSWNSETRNRSWPISQSLFSQNLSFSESGFDGHLNLDLPVTGNVQIAATYKIRKCFGVPVGFKFVNAVASGTAQIAGNGDLAANATLAAQWEKEWKLAEPELGEVTFTVGWIPVRLVFTLPIFAGTAVDAKLTGSLSAHLDATATGTFSYTCTTDNCSGTSDFADNFSFDGPTASASVDLNAKVHARVMLRVGIYDQSVAYVEGGLKAYAKASVWGYIGNGCGDGDGDGNNETVRALAADLLWGYQFAYGWGGLLLPDRLSYTGGNEYPLAWQDLLGAGGSTALQPMLLGPASVIVGTPANYTVKMRPCYPYSQAVNFSLTPGTWTGPTSVTPPAGTADVQTTFASTGNPVVTVTAIDDGYGRHLQIGYSRSISVTTNTPVAPSALSAAVVSGVSVRLAWTDNSANETSFEIQRRLSPAGSFSPVAFVAPNVTAWTDTTVVAGSTYEYKVRARNDAGASGFTNTVSAAAPGNISGYLGCYTDSATRALPVQLGGVAETIETCRQAAFNAGYRYAGLQSAGNCFAGNTLGYTLVANGECNMPCASNPSEMCGGALRNSVYDTGYNPPPVAPSSLAGSAPSPTSVLLTWVDNSNNETQFEIQRRLYPSGTFALLATAVVNAVSWTDGTAQAATSYEYRVRAKNGTGPSSFSNSVVVTTPPQPPASPSGLSAVALSATSVQVSWIDNSSNETQFEVQRNPGSGAFVPVATTASNVVTWIDNSVSPATTYGYRVRAANGGGSSAFTATVNVTTPPQTLNPPTGLAASYNSATTRFTLTWLDNSNNELGFTIQFSYSGSAFSDLATVGANVTSYTSGANPPTGSYQFRIRAYNASLVTSWSATASLIVAPPLPTTSIAWIKTAEKSWGPAGTLTVAGYAANGGTSDRVTLVWRERSSSGVWGSWTTVAYTALPSADTTWSNTISSGSPTNKCHWFDAYSIYGGTTSAVFHFTGDPDCPVSGP